MYELKCDINIYTGVNDKLLFYGIGSLNNPNNFIIHVTFKILDKFKNIIYSNKVNYQLYQDFFSDEIFINSFNTIHCYLKYIIERIYKDLGITYSNYYNFIDKSEDDNDNCDYKNWSIIIDKNTLLKYTKSTINIIKIKDKKIDYFDIRNPTVNGLLTNLEKEYINKHKHNSYTDIQTLKFKLNNKSKKQFIIESQNTTIQLRQIVWKFITLNELIHYFSTCSKNNSCDNCISSKNKVNDNKFIITEYF